MKALSIALALSLGGCSTLTFNGQPLSDADRIGLAAVGVLVAGMIIQAGRVDGAENELNFRCPSCPPLMPEPLN